MRDERLEQITRDHSLLQEQIDAGMISREAARRSQNKNLVTRALGIEPLPTSLGLALTVMERSELVAETLGEHVYVHFLRNKRQEWADYRRQVTPYELARYLPVL